MATNNKENLQIKEGKLVQIIDNKEIEVGNAIYVEGEIANIDTDVKTVKLSFKYKDQVVTRKLKRDELKSSGIAKLTQYGADSWSEVAELYTTYIRDELKKIDLSYEHTNVGWGSYEGKDFFRLHEGVGFNSKYDGIKYNIQPKGSLDEWMKCIAEEVIGNRWLEFALAAGFSAPLIKIIGEYANMDSIFINFYGVSSTGKTLATRLAVSPFGFPDKRDKGLIQSWYGTDAGILESLKGNYGIPIAIDDTSTAEGDKDFTQFIYNIAGGQEKAALNCDGTKRSQEEWMTTSFSSSEVSILKNTDQRSGLRVRFFEVNEPCITKSAENAEAIERVILKNYGHAGIIYADHLLEIGKEEICNRWEETRKDIIRKMNNDPFSKRISAKLALVRLAGELANEALNLGLDIELLTDSLIRIEKKSSQTRDIGERAYQYIMGYFASNPHKFFKDKDTKKPYRELTGKYFEKNGVTSEIRIPTEKFIELMNKGKFDLEQVVDLWNEKDILHSDKGKNTLSRVFEAGKPSIYQYAIRVTDIYNKLDNDNKEEMKEVEDSKIVAKKWNKEEEKHSQQSLQVEYEMKQEKKQLSKNKVSSKVSISKGKPKGYKDFDEFNDMESVG